MTTRCRADVGKASRDAAQSLPRTEEGAPIKVLHSAVPGAVGGLETVLVGLTRGLRRAGADVSVAAVVHSDPTRHPFVRMLRQEGVAVHPIVASERGYFRERHDIRRLLETRQPDLLHTHGHRADILHAGLARKREIPTVTTVHGSSRMSRRTAFYEWLQFRLFRKFDAVVAVSRPLVEDLRGVGVAPERIQLIPNAWAGSAPLLSRTRARRSLGLPADAFIVGWVGRLIPVKGCDVFLQSLAQLPDLPIVGSIIGDGPERARLEGLASTLGLDDRVHFHGSRDRAAELFSAFDAWALSSRSEGTPMVLFEAMAAGVPIIAARVGGVGDVVSEAEAFLFPPEDPPALADRIRRAYSGGAGVENRVRAAARRLGAEFGTDGWTGRHMELYRSLVRRRPLARSQLSLKDPSL